MTLDWSVPIGTIILLAVQFVVGIIAIQRSIDRRFSEMTLQLNTFEMGDLRELKTSVKRLETGQDEWTKTLRERTHDLADEVGVLKIKVDRLERPERYPHNRRHDDRKDEES